MLKNLNMKKIKKYSKLFDGKAYFKSYNLEIEFGEIISNQSTLITSVKNNVKVFDLEKELLIETRLINLDKNKNILKSTTPSVLTDKLNNILKTNNFNYNLENSILKLEKVEFKDIYNNSFNVEIAYLNTITNELVGKDILANLDNKSFNKENEPRIKGRSIEYNKKWV